MYCKHCGESVAETTVNCPKCGKNTGAIVFKDQGKDELDFIGKAGSLLLPFIGGIIYLVNVRSNPGKAKDACTYAIIGMVIGLILRIIAESAAK